MSLVDVCYRIARTSEFSVELARSQFNQRTGELLADPTGQTPLLLVRSGTGWSALTRKEDIPPASLKHFDPVGLALQLTTGDSNGFLTTYRDVQLVPAGFLVRVTKDGLEPVSDDLREYLLSHRSSIGSWDDDLLTSDAVDSTKSWLFLSGGLDSIAVLLSYQLEGRSLGAIHIDRRGLEHESRYARDAVSEVGSQLHTVAFSPFTPEDIFADSRFSPFGRCSNFSFYRRALQEVGPRDYVLNGELDGLDVGFTDHSDRFRGVRRQIYKNSVIRSAYLAAGAVAGKLPLINSAASKFTVAARSLGTSESPLAFALGSLWGPKGFPGAPPLPFVRDQRTFMRDVTNRIGRFAKIGGKSSFDVDFYLLAYRWYLGKSNCTGLQEAARSCRSQVLFPFNKAQAMVRQVSLPPNLQVDKKALKDHFAARFPKLSDLIYYKKENSVGNNPAARFVASGEWDERVDDALRRIPDLPMFDQSMLPTLLATRKGSFKGTEKIPTEGQINLISLMAAREG